jgi:hypothetical protein
MQLVSKHTMTFQSVRSRSMKKQNATWWRALVSRAAMTAALPAAALSVSALVGCDTVKSTSSSTNWLECSTDAECMMFEGATCNDDLICEDAAGNPIAVNESQNGLVAGGGATAEDACNDGAATTLCLSAGGAAGSASGNSPSGGAGGATTGSSGAATAAGGSGGVSAGGASNGGASAGGVSAGGASPGGTGNGGASNAGAGGSGASNAGAGGSGGSSSGEACDCALGGYCERSSCELDAPGECAVMPELCAANFAPVCGCDGVTYSNACGAAGSGINVDTTGAACENARVVLTIVVGTLGPLAQWYNGTEESIFLRGCSTVDAWYREDGEWIEYGALANCAVETEIVEVTPGTGRTEPLPTAPERGDDIWRLVGPYGVGCTPGSLFSDGECDETFEVTSYNETDWGR